MLTVKKCPARVALRASRYFSVAEAVLWKHHRVIGLHSRKVVFVHRIQYCVQPDGVSSPHFV